MTRQLIGLVPYGPIKRLGRWAIQANQRRLESPQSQGHVPGMLLFSNVGELDHDRLVFRGTEVADAFETTGIFNCPGILGMTVSMFKGSLTLRLGFGPSPLMTRMFERIMQILPAQTPVSSTG